MNSKVSIFQATLSDTNTIELETNSKKMTKTSFITCSHETPSPWIKGKILNCSPWKQNKECVYRDLWDTAKANNENF